MVLSLRFSFKSDIPLMTETKTKAFLPCLSKDKYVGIHETHLIQSLRLGYNLNK